MTSPATDSPPKATVAPPVAKTPAGALEIITAAMVAAVAVHLVVACAGGMFIFPWIAGMFAVEPKPKVVKKESVEVEMVEPVLAEPPPPEVQPPPPDQPPPPESLPTPVEPQLIPPVVSTPVDLPDRRPLPVPRIAAVTPAALNTPRTNPAPYIPPTGGSGPSTSKTPAPLVDSRIFQRNLAEYPYEARKRRIQGTPIVEVIFDEQGKLVSVDLSQSSGHAILDRAALAHALKEIYAPAGQPRRVRMEIEFRMKQ